MSLSRPPTDVIIIGAGPAGLAVGACLRRQRVPFRIFEKGERIGSRWHDHYERLHLHTDRAHSNLPRYGFPRSYPRYPSRHQVIEYLEKYARRFDLEPQFGQEVVEARRGDGVWRVRTRDSEHDCRCLVVATGFNAVPHRPRWPGQERYRGAVLHSAEYRNGLAYRGARVLVVGLGNSGGEIAIDLHDYGARPWLAVRSPVNVIPRELFGIPILALAIPMVHLPPRLADAITTPLVRLVFGDLRRLGLRRRPYGPFTQIERSARVPLIDVGTLDLIERGAVEVVPGIQRFHEDAVVFEDGRALDFDAVILATGFRPALSRMLPEAAHLFDGDGAPRRSGVESQIPGLFFCGFYVAPTGMLREVGKEAQRIAKAVKRRLRGIAP